MKITIGIITYNQERLVIQTMESIKYQILRYGEGNEYTLIISDDGSKDKTVNNIQFWLKKNNVLFSNVKFLADGINRGTAKNFVRLLNEIEDRYFKVISGDDILSYYNLKEYFDKLEDYDIITSNTIGIKQDKVCYSGDLFLYFSKKNIRFLRREIKNGNCFIAPETIFNKSVINQKLLNFIQNFDLIEDYPMFIKIFENEKIKCAFVNEPMEFYRVSENSVTRSPKHRKRFLEDQIRLEDYLIKNEKSKLFKIKHTIKKQFMKIENKKYSPLAYITKLKWIYRKIIVCCCMKNERELLKKNSQQYQKYFDIIVRQSNIELNQLSKL